jgi:hypothetical protein
LNAVIHEDESKIKQVKVLGEKVIPGTNNAGVVNVRAQIDSCQQEWQSLLSSLGYVWVLPPEPKWIEYVQNPSHVLLQVND